MKTIEKIKALLAKHKDELEEKFKVKEIGIFGSFARKEQRKKSDVDILVEFSETIDLFTFVELGDYLNEILGIKVDVVMKDTLKPRIKERILSEAIYL